MKNQSFAAYRENLIGLVHEHLAFAFDIEAPTERVKDLRDQLSQGELSVAVVGEINRGKSTFLNALMGEEVFPSRTMICTAGVTVLDHGDEPCAEVLYRDGSTDAVDITDEAPAEALKSVVSRTNKDVQDIEVTRVWFPNDFAGNGVVLVDTPGVNDPDNWREEITYSYLADADAVIMLLDPMQPISASEVEFLDAKILDRSIANLLFVVNKIDDVPKSDREDALRRTEDMLSEHVPNPSIYPVAAKPALDAKRYERREELRGTGFPEFEAGLMEFLSKGRGGLLLKTKIQRGLEHLAHIEDTIEQRRSALDEKKGEVEGRLRDAEQNLENLRRKRDGLEKKLSQHRKQIEGKLRSVVKSRSRYLTNSLKPAISGESDPDALRDRALRFQRDTVQMVKRATENALDDLLRKYDASSTELVGEIEDVLGNLRREASNRAASMNVERRRAGRHLSDDERKKAGAAVGGGLGAAAGAAVAASATTTTVTATGAIATTGALGTLGVIGAGALTGGIGLLIGLGAAAMMGSGQSRDQSKYIEARDIVSNDEAVRSLRTFLDRVQATVATVSEGIVDSAQETILRPVDTSRENQQKLIQQIRQDLTQTTEGQRELRTCLTRRQKRLRDLRDRYLQLSAEIDQLVG